MVEHWPDEAAQALLIERLVAMMNERGITYWLHGGWGVDFHLGRVSRQHSDIDFVVELDHRQRLRMGLDAWGAGLFRADPAGGVESFDLDGIEVEVTYVTTVDGILVTPGYEIWPWPPETLPNDTVTFRGITARAVSAEGLLEIKKSWQSQLGERLRPQDHADIAALQELLATR